MASLTIDEKLVDRILNCDWLANCGIKGREPPGIRYDWETDKEEVIEYVNSKKFEFTWSNICLEAQNDVTSFLFHNHRNEYHIKWNQFAEEVKEIIIPQITPIVTERIDQLGLPHKPVWDDIRFNVGGIAIVSYYKEYVRSPFYDNLMDIYCSGHLPFGWRGKYPLYGTGWYGKAPKGVIRVY